MEYAIWNKTVLSATEVSEKFEDERQVRLLSKEKQLKCPDAECQNPIVRYCHGEKKIAYFAHLSNCSCDYGQFDRNNSFVLRGVRVKLMKIVQKAGVNVKAEQKVLDHHYCQLLIELSENKKIAVEFGTAKTDVSYIEKLEKEYREKSIAIKWFFVGDTHNGLRENNLYYLKRHSLNRTANEQFIIISSDCEKVAQYRLDGNSYLYLGKKVKFTPDTDLYFEISDFENLEFTSGDFSLKGFSERFDNWRLKKEEAFNRKVAIIEQHKKEVESMKRRQEIEDFRRRKRETKQISFIESDFTPKERVETTIKYYCGEEILERINQQDVQVRDSSGRRWIKCECCGKIDVADCFSSYGGRNHVKLGICEDCARKK